MVEKKEEKRVYSDGGIGIAGFTLGILSIVLFITGLGIWIGIVGFFLCLYQQRKAPTRMGKVGLILNLIGFIFGLIFLIFYTIYLLPRMNEMMQAMQQAQILPTA